MAHWAEDGYATVAAELGGVPGLLLFDTGFPRTSLGAQSARGLELTALTVSVAGMTAGPLPAGLITGPVETGAVLGSDVLHQLPVVFDARARTTSVLPTFVSAHTGAPLRLAESGRCTEADARRSPLFLVDGEVEGRTVTLLLDTGAEATFVSSEIYAALDARPTLQNVRVASAFAGIFEASATRARHIDVGEAASTGVVVLSSHEIDAELARLSSIAGLTLSGFLGWNFLRELEVSLAPGSSALDDRRLSLTRFDSQTHWKRELIGVGIFTEPSLQPPGLRVNGFLSVSPAREAGVEAGDVILAVDGVAAAQAPSPFAAPGATVRLDLQRGASSLALDVAVRDLLPDPP